MRRVGFVLRPNSKEIYKLFESIKEKFEERGVEVYLSDIYSNRVGDGYVKFEDMCREVDILISLGGDGTLLSLVRKSYGFDKPILGINAGNLGFLADTRVEQVDEMIDVLLSGDYRIDNRMLIYGYIETKLKKHKFYAFNDVVITRPTISHMAKIDAFIDKDWFNSYYGDGLLISTPTGSTAYNLSLGGPILYPLSKVFIMTPIAPHSLTQRPLVVPSDFTIHFTSPNRLVVVVDGQDNYTLYPDDKLVIKGAIKDAKLIHKKEHSYFKVLREKLSWGGEQ